MNSMTKLIVQRTAFGFLTLILISLLIFLGVELLPGDVAEAVLGQRATAETLAAFRKELRLDLPPHERYLKWLGDSPGVIWAILWPMESLWPS